MSVDDYLARLQGMAARAGDVKPATEAMAAEARKWGVQMLSHDDVTPAMRDEYRRLGAHIAEFPMNWETVEAAAAARDYIVLGSPNVVRGRQS